MAGRTEVMMLDTLGASKKRRRFGLLTLLRCYRRRMSIQEATSREIEVGGWSLKTTGGDTQVQLCMTKGEAVLEQRDHK